MADAGNRKNYGSGAVGRPGSLEHASGKPIAIDVVGGVACLPLGLFGTLTKRASVQTGFVTAGVSTVTDERYLWIADPAVSLLFSESIPIGPLGRCRAPKHVVASQHRRKRSQIDYDNTT